MKNLPAWRMEYTVRSAPGLPSQAKRAVELQGITSV